VKHYETILPERIGEHLPKVNRPEVVDEKHDPWRKGR
jgi:hypothetical protein